MQGYERLLDLQSKLTKLQKEHDLLLQGRGESKDLAIEALTKHYEAQLQQQATQLHQLQEARKMSLKNFQETRKQMEEESDREILDVRNKYEIKSRVEKEEIAHLIGERGFLKKQVTCLQEEIDGHKNEIKESQLENTNQAHVIGNLKKDIWGLKEEIQEKKDIILDKEKINIDLNIKIKELSKFKFVLEYKLKELRNLIEPKDNDIKTMKETINEMESELKSFNKQNSGLKLDVKELNRKLEAKDKELKEEREKMCDAEAVVKRLKNDIHSCAGYINDPKMLKESLIALHSKHVQDHANESDKKEADIQKEFGRQRNLLEGSVATLRKRLDKEGKIHGAEKVRIMEENASLIEELNELRRSLKTARSHIFNLEVAAGIQNKRNETDAKSIIATPGTVIEVEGNERNAETIESQSLPTSDLSLQSHLPIRLPSIKQAASKLATSPPGTVINGKQHKVVNIVEVRSLPVATLKVRSRLLSSVRLPSLKPAASKF